ncbi:MAG: hypothetical protein H7Y06_11615 [Opitutaceae bacterium]|nr:hypothetical protein [Opitutaceae bacterium]
MIQQTRFRPIIWGLYSTSTYNGFTNANTAAHRSASETTPWKPVLTPAELAAVRPDPETAHACLIVGYNRSSNEIAVSDSW